MSLNIERDKTVKVSFFWNCQTINILMQAKAKFSAELLLHDFGKSDGKLDGKIELCKYREQWVWTSR